MDTLSYKTISVKPEAQVKNWVLVDAESAVLGRLASQVAKMIRGKHKPGYTPHIDCGDHVIVINADKIKLTGSKWTEKEYLSHTGYPGGQRVTTPRRLAAKHPASIIERAVKGMLPKNRLGRQLFRSLHVYAGPSHPHVAQNPTPVSFEA